MMTDQQPRLPTRSARAIRGVFAGTLCLEALTVLFVPRAVAQFGSGLTTAKLTFALSVAGALILTACVLRFRWALVVGSALQLAIIACGVMTGAMYVLGAIFTAIWIYELWVRRQVIDFHSHRPDQSDEEG